MMRSSTTFTMCHPVKSKPFILGHILNFRTSKSIYIIKIRWVINFKSGAEGLSFSVHYQPVDACFWFVVITLHVHTLVVKTGFLGFFSLPYLWSSQATCSGVPHHYYLNLKQSLHSGGTKYSECISSHGLRHNNRTTIAIFLSWHIMGYLKSSAMYRLRDMGTCCISWFLNFDHFFGQIKYFLKKLT